MQPYCQGGPLQNVSRTCLGDPERLPIDGFVVDVRAWPIVIVAHCGRVSDAQLETYLEFMGDLQKGGDRGQKSALVYRMLPGASMLNAKQRKRQAEWLSQKGPSAHNGSQGIAFVFSSSMARGALQAIFWIAPPGYEYSIVSSLEEAMKWAQDRVRS